jgi:hypothetical protein
VNTALDSAHAL